MIGKIKTGPSADECALDVETIASLAPGGNVIIYLIPKLSSTAIDDAANKIVSDNTAEVVNMSFGATNLKMRPLSRRLPKGTHRGSLSSLPAATLDRMAER